MMRVRFVFLVLMLVLPSRLTGITTTSDPKEPKPPNITTMEEIEELSPASTSRINITERQRRLIPYMTFYLTRNFNHPSDHLQDLREPQPPPPQPPQYRLVPQKITVQPFHGKIILVNQVNQVNQPKYTEPPPVLYQPKVRFTPFLESNKLPGGFTPIRNPQHERQPIRVQVLNSPQTAVQPQPVPINKEPNYSSIFDKLLQLKQMQYTKPPQYELTPQYQNQKPNQFYTRDFATPRPTKFITLESYQPESAPPAKTYIHTYTPANIDISNENKVQNYENFESLKTYNQIPAPVSAKEYDQVYQIEQQEPDYQQIPQIQNNQHPQPSNQEQKSYEPIIIRPIYRPIPVAVKTYRPVYHQPTEPTVSSSENYSPTENPHSLSVILKQLQDSNTLPQTLTPDNIDNSIKTLVHILNALKQTQKFQRPIVVAQTDGSVEPQTEENIDEYDDSILPETVSQSYPANTPEGGTPGKPGIDYPAYSLIPQTNFNCKKQRYKGFFGDPDTNCQVWHYCDLNGGQASFLCPNGTIFSQVALTCDWWYNVKCATTTQLYVLNERLYKYILPFTPKFPEDYSGPLVDRYLALKFKEMEEKMKKQKKGKTSTDDEQNSEVNKLEDIQAEPEDDDEPVAETQEHTTKTSQEISDNQ